MVEPKKQSKAQKKEQKNLGRPRKTDRSGKYQTTRKGTPKYAKTKSPSQKIQKRKIPKSEKLTRKQSKQFTAKKGGPKTIIGHPSKKGKGPYKVEYKNTARQRRKHLDKKTG